MTESHSANGLLILDIPVPHRGYIDLLKKHAEGGDVKTLYLVGEDLRDSLGVPREIRANDTETTRKMLEGLAFPFDIEILGLDNVDSLPSSGLYTAKDTVSRRLRDKYFPKAQVNEESVFLRWDESNVTSTRPALVDEETKDSFHISMMRRARKLADNSSDWWRRVGVVVVRDGKILVEAYNQALPTDHKPYIDGNPRDFIQAGTLAFLVSTVHGEQAAIAKASSSGIKLEGADLYLNSFPCPPCATSMGLAGIRRCFAADGNAYLDTAEVLKNIGIKTIFVKED
jgi:dCMP deaminase